MTTDHPIVKISDNLVNFVSGLGTKSHDKMASTEFTYTKLDRYYLGILYRNWLFGKVVDVPADDMTRKWRNIKATSLDADQLDEYKKAEADYKVRAKVTDALKWSRLYGGAAVIIGVDDGLEDTMQPLNLEAIKPGDLKYFDVVDSNDCVAYRAGTFRVAGESVLPEFYQLVNSNTILHHTRVIRFDGYKLPRDEFERNEYWGGSVAERVYDEILNSKITTQSIASMIFEATIDVVGVSGLFERLMNKTSTNALISRFQLANLTKSINKTLIIDKEQEELTRVSNNFSGLPGLISEYLSVVAAAADIPATRMLGQSAKGFSATGEGDLENYYDMIEGKQDTDLAAQLRMIDEVLTRNTWGFMPDDWESEFNKLWQVKPKEQSEIEKIDSETDTINLTNGVAMPHHVASRVQASGIYPNMTPEWVEQVEKADEAEIAAAEARMNAMGEVDPDAPAGAPEDPDNMDNTDLDDPDDEMIGE